MYIKKCMLEIEYKSNGEARKNTNQQSLSVLTKRRSCTDTLCYEDGSVENNVTRDYIKFVQQTSQDKPTQEVVNEQDIVARVVAENLSENILLENNTLRAEVKMLRSRLNALTKSLPRKRKVINAFDKMMSAAVTQPKKIVTQQQREDKKSSSSHGDVCSRGKRAVANKACIISHLISTHVFAYHTHITV